MKKINVYFFGEDSIHLGDMVWFYGIGFIVPLSLATLVYL